MQVSVVLEIRAFYIRAHARRQVISTSFLGLGEGPGVMKIVRLQGRKQEARRSYFKYRPFHKTLPRSSASANRISVRFYETDCILKQLKN